jgi:hypothetical protein
MTGVSFEVGVVVGYIRGEERRGEGNETPRERI